MPAMDKTGPSGQGPLTGRGFGACGKANQRFPLARMQGIQARELRRGFGRGFSLTKSEEKKVLESELKEIDADKKDIEKRLKELK